MKIEELKKNDYVIIRQFGRNEQVCVIRAIRNNYWIDVKPLFYPNFGFATGLMINECEVIRFAKYSEYKNSSHYNIK